MISSQSAFRRQGDPKTVIVLSRISIEPKRCILLRFIQSSGMDRVIFIGKVTRGSELKYTTFRGLSVEIEERGGVVGKTFTNSNWVRTLLPKELPVGKGYLLKMIPIPVLTYQKPLGVWYIDNPSDRRKH